MSFDFGVKFFQHSDLNEEEKGNEFRKGNEL